VLSLQETSNGLEEFDWPICRHITTEGCRKRPHVRAFIDGSIHIAHWRRDGKSGASRSSRQSDAFHHDQGRRPDPWGLASEARSFDRLSTRLATQFQKLPHGM